MKITSQKSVNGQDYSALFAVNNGTVKNLRFAVATIGENGVENASVVAGINNGTIEQVAMKRAVRLQLRMQPVLQSKTTVLLKTHILHQLHL